MMNNNLQSFSNMNLYPELEHSKKNVNISSDEYKSANSATHPANKPIVSTHYFAIDSRQRDYNLYPDANNYNVQIPDSYNNITSIELKAAMLPRSEYNVNTCNKYIDFVIGDYISSIKIKPGKNGNIVTNNNKEVQDGTYYLTISSTYGSGANISAYVSSGLIKTITILDPGSGYSYADVTQVYLFDFNFFEIEIGEQYITQLREGQYTIGGNPVMNESAGSENSYQSWTPSKLLNEIEASMSNAVLQDAEYCYSRKAGKLLDKSESIPDNTKDYPLLFTARLMSQYPDLPSYDNSVSTRNDPENFETNACKFNRIYFSNVLIFNIDFGTNDITDLTINGNGNHIFYDENDFEYEILKHHNYFETKYIVYCGLVDPLKKIGNYWEGLKDGFLYESVGTVLTGATVELAHWEILFSTGKNYVVNSASLFGFNKRNYGHKSRVNNVSVILNNYADATKETVLIPRGLTYSSENDYYLYGDPEYIVLSFRPKYGANNVKGINNRVDSLENSNINRVFACLIYDTIQPSVLQDLTSGVSIEPINSYANSANSNKTFMVQNKNFSESTLLSGNVGNLNSSDYARNGMLRAMKGADFDRKIIEFYQPMSSLSHLNIRFSKFSKGAIGSSEELYNFHGKEHFLLFEIKCGDLQTGDRF